jgi:hypothetical protein
MGNSEAINDEPVILDFSGGLSDRMRFDLRAAVHVGYFNYFQFPVVGLAHVKVKTLVVRAARIEVQLEAATGAVFLLVGALIDGDRCGGANHRTQECADVSFLFELAVGFLNGVAHIRLAEQRQENLAIQPLLVVLFDVCFVLNLLIGGRWSEHRNGREIRFVPIGRKYH